MTQTQRVLRILHKLKEGETVCTHDLAIQYAKSTSQKDKENAKRVAQTDIKIIKNFLPYAIKQSPRGCYVLLNKEYINSLLPSEEESKDYDRFMEFLVLFDENILDNIANEEQKSYIETLKKETHKLYHIHSGSMESFKEHHVSMMHTLKKAVKGKRYVTLTFEDNCFTMIQPHRIVYAQGNWYLASFDQTYTHNNGFRFSRISRIKEIEIHSNTFQANKEIEAFIINFQSLFSNFKKESYKVELKISSKIAKFFQNKKYLSSQTVFDNKNKDGSLKVQYEINNEMEILPLVKKWLPEIEIVSPDWLREKLYKDVKKFLSGREDV